MARPEGVVIVSEHFWALATSTGELREGEMPSAPRRLRRVPLLRGLAKLASALSPLFRSTGIARPYERWVLGAALILTFVFPLVPIPSRAASLGEVVLTVGLVCWMMRGRTLFLHGAEHRAIAAAEQRQLSDTWNGYAKPTRFAARCGTNFAALVLPAAVLLNHFAPRSTASYAPLAVTVLALALTMELWRYIQSGRRWTRVLLLPGFAVQRVTTREPRLDETQVALTALASVVRRELALGSGSSLVATMPLPSAA